MFFGTSNQNSFVHLHETIWLAPRGQRRHLIGRFFCFSKVQRWQHNGRHECEDKARVVVFLVVWPFGLSLTFDLQVFFFWFILFFYYVFPSFRLCLCGVFGVSLSTVLALIWWPIWQLVWRFLSGRFGVCLTVFWKLVCQLLWPRLDYCFDFDLLVVFALDHHCFWRLFGGSFVWFACCFGVCWVCSFGVCFNS